MFQQGQHIVVHVETHDLAMPDLEDLAVPQFVRAPRCWKRSRGQVEWANAGPPTRKLKGDLILRGKHIGRLCPTIREGLCVKLH